MQGISIREFARRDGCDKTVVQRALQSGRLQALADGRMDPDLVGTAWRKGNEPDGGGDRPRAPTPPERGRAEQKAPAAKAPLDPDSKAYAERRKERAIAALREIDLDRAQELVAPVDEIAAMVVAEYAKVRTRLVGIPVKVAGRAATMRSPTEIQALVAAEINQALEELSLDAGGGSSGDASREVRARAFPTSGQAGRRAS